MAQADYIISNQTFPNTRADINNHLSAIATNNSGTSAPTTQYAGQFWIDTTSTTWTLYIHDGSDDIQFATIDTSANTVNFTDSALDVVTDTTPQLGGDLDTNGNNINFGDNDKAQFGASNNLQIYHDGTNSYIDDVGSGSLKIRSNTLVISDTAGDNMLVGLENGEAQLYHNGSEKLATKSTGVDVTGTVVSDGLTVDINTLYVDSANNFVGIGTTSPAEKLEVNGDVKASRFYTSTGTSGSATNIPATSQGDGWTTLQFKSQAGTTDANFIEFDGLTAGSNQSSSWIGARYNGNWTSNLEFYSAKQTNTSVSNYDSALSARFAQNNIIFFTGTAGTSDTSERMRIDSSGQIGVGTTSPSAKLHIESGNSGVSPNADADELFIENASGTNAGITIGSGTSNAGNIAFADSGDNLSGLIQYQHANNLMRFFAGGAERCRIKTDRFLVSASGNDIGGSNVGGQIETAGTVSFNRSNFVTMFVQRRDSDGSLVDFQQDGATEGSISVSGATVSYNGFTGTHWSRLSDNSKPTILKGTILESLDEMMDWYQVHFTIQEEGKDDVQMEKSYVLQEGESVGDIITYNYEGTNYQATIVKENDVKHSKAKISDTSESKAVYGVFVDWDNDDDTVNDMYVAQTGTFVVRMNGSETVSKGDLIQSNGDGTGKVQADDIIRSSTVAKVLSTTKIETYEDGSYIVPCSLHC